MKAIRGSAQVSRDLVHHIWRCIKKTSSHFEVAIETNLGVELLRTFLWKRIPMEVFVRMFVVALDMEDEK